MLLSVSVLLPCESTVLPDASFNSQAEIKLVNSDTGYTPRLAGAWRMAALTSVTLPSPDSFEYRLSSSVKLAIAAAFASA